MRTKTLLLAAALSAAGAATSMAQTVYSVNMVGYVNQVIPTGFSLIANHLNTADNTLNSICAGLPDGTIAFKFNGSSFDTSGKADGAFENNYTLNPGEGIFIQNTAGHALTNTFVGEVVLHSTNAIPAGYSVRASVLPISSTLEDAQPAGLGFPKHDGDIVFAFNGASFDTHLEADGAFDPPYSPKVGEAFFIKAGGVLSWVQTFTVGQ